MNIVGGILNWFFIGAIGLVAVMFLVMAVMLCLTFLAAIWEKQYVTIYSPLLPSDRVEVIPYYTVMNQLATDSGYQPGGEYYLNRQGAFSKVRGSLWLSPDGLILGVIAGGKVAGMRYRRTRMYTRLRDGGIIMTIDDHTVMDMSQTTDAKVLARADFEELARVHARRIIVRSDEALPYSRENLAEQLNHRESERVRLVVSLGYGRYLDSEKTTWRHTVRGARQLTFAGVFRGIREAEDQSERKHLSRPGG